MQWNGKMKIQRFVFYVFLLLFPATNFAFHFPVEHFKVFEDKPSLDSKGILNSDLNATGELFFLNCCLENEDIVFATGTNLLDFCAFTRYPYPDLNLYAFDSVIDSYFNLVSKIVGGNFFPELKFLSDREGSEDTLFDEVSVPSWAFFEYSTEFKASILTYFQLPSIKNVLHDSIDNYVTVHALDAIDILYIGPGRLPYTILEGAEDLEDGQLKTVMFTYIRNDSGMQDFIEDVYDLLIERNYVVYRIIPNALIHIPSWRAGLTLLPFSVYFAVHKSLIES